MKAISGWERLYREVMKKPSRGRSEAVLRVQILKLTLREAQVLRFLFGVGVAMLSHEEVGQRYSVTGKRIREIEKKAKQKLFNLIRPPTPAELRAKKAREEWAIAEKGIPLLLRDPQDVSAFGIQALAVNKRMLVRALRRMRRNLDECERRYKRA